MDDSEDLIEAPETDADWEKYLRSLGEEEMDAAEEIFGRTKISIDKSVVLLEDAKKIGESTLNKLEAQGDQLKKVDAQLSEIREHNYDNKRKLRVVRSVFGELINKIFKCKCLQPQDDDWDEPDPLPQRPKHEVDNSSSSGAPNGSTPLFNLYKETDMGLDRIQELTLDLNWLAKSMNTVINNQNENLDRIYEKADKALEEMRTLTRSTKETLN